MVDPILFVPVVLAFVGGGFLGWRLGVSSQAQVKQVVEDVSKGQLGDAVKDAQPKQ